MNQRPTEILDSVRLIISDPEKRLKNQLKIEPGKENGGISGTDFIVIFRAKMWFSET